MLLWWTAAAQGAPVAPHRCATAPHAGSPACACLVADPDGPSWWGGAEPPSVAETCFDWEAVIDATPDGHLFAEALYQRARRIASDRGYQLIFAGLVTQDGKDQLSDHVWLEGYGPTYELRIDGKPVAIVETHGRVPWGDVVVVDDDGDKVADYVVPFVSGELWVIYGPLNGELVELDPKK
ncbi:MAG: hypothetical protein ABMA64_27430 [Myxococcota bacterium]